MFLVPDRRYKYVDNNNCLLPVNLFIRHFACLEVFFDMRSVCCQAVAFPHYIAVYPAFIPRVVVFRNFPYVSHRAENDFVLIRILSTRFY